MNNTYISYIHGVKQLLHKNRSYNFFEKLYYRAIHKIKENALTKPFKLENHHYWKQDQNNSYSWLKHINIHPTWIDYKFNNEIEDGNYPWLAHVIFNRYSREYLLKWSEILIYRKHWIALSYLISYLPKDIFNYAFWKNISDYVLVDDLLYLYLKSNCQNIEYITPAQYLSQMCLIDVLHKFQFKQLIDWIEQNKWSAPSIWWLEDIESFRKISSYHGLFQSQYRFRISSLKNMFSNFRLKKAQFNILKYSPKFKIIATLLCCDHETIVFGEYLHKTWLMVKDQDTIDADYLLNYFFQWKRLYDENPSPEILTYSLISKTPFECASLIIHNMNKSDTYILESEFAF